MGEGPKEFCPSSAANSTLKYKPALQAKPDGYEVEHNGDCVTVFSAPNYCDQMGNKGAFIRFEASNMIPQFTTFEAVPHPDIKAMAYASSMFGSSLLGV